MDPILLERAAEVVETVARTVDPGDQPWRHYDVQDQLATLKWRLAQRENSLAILEEAEQAAAEALRVAEQQGEDAPPALLT